MRTNSTVECGMAPRPTVNLACVRAPRRVRRQETGVMRQELFSSCGCFLSIIPNSKITVTYGRRLGFGATR